jgi:hypothetical protein
MGKLFYYKRELATIILLFISSFIYSQEQRSTFSMLDPSTDIAGKEWCYLAKSTVVIGRPFQPDVTQITYDGAVYTRHAELDFYYGKNNAPLLARQKTFYKGWIPVVQYDWMENGLQYHIEYFSAPLEGYDVDNSVNFVKYSVTNKTNRESRAIVKSALCYNSGDYRFGKIEFFPDSMFLATPETGFARGWVYEMKNDVVYRGDSIVYTYSKDAAKEALPGITYTKAFKGGDVDMTPGKKSCIAVYNKTLKPGESFSAVFKMPRVPVASSDKKFIAALQKADYDGYRTKTIDYWTSLMKGKCNFEIPEARVQNAYRAGIVEALLATRNTKGKNKQTDGLPYPDFFLTSAPETALLYLSAGLNQYPEKMMMPDAILQQQANGLYFDQAVAHGKLIPAAHGHILYSLAMTAIFTQDKDFASKVFPSIKKGIEFLKTSVDTNKYGLLPPCYAYDAEMITGHYSGQNFFTLMGLRSCIRVARMLGKKEEEAAWTSLAERYEKNILKAIDASANPDGYVPTGLYDYLIGQKARAGFDEYMTDADWENIILAYPTEVLSPSDNRVAGTLKRVRKDYAEGIMTYRHGMFLHQYITSNMIQQYLAAGDGYTALKDFYHQLLHSGSASECFENVVKPWTDRQVDPVCPPPHAWGGSKQALTVRNFLLMEYGGRNGMDRGQRELWIYHCLSPEWVVPGKEIKISNAATEFGTVNSSMKFSQSGARVEFRAMFHEAPRCYRIRTPYFKELVSFKSDAKIQEQKDGCILLSPDATWLTVEWKDKPMANMGTVEDILNEYRGSNKFKGVSAGKAIIETATPFILPSEKSDKPQPLSFELVRKTFQYEYARLVKQMNNDRVLKIVPPSIMTDNEQKNTTTQK